MKNILIFITSFLFWSTSVKSQSAALQTLTLEAGNTNSYTSICWYFKSMSIYNQSNKINGSYSLRSGNLGYSEDDDNYAGFKTPWIMPTSGNITLKTRLELTTGSNVTLRFYYVGYHHSDDEYEDNEVEFGSYTFPTPRTTAVQDISIAIPQAIRNATQPYKIIVKFLGGSNSNKVIVDDVYVPGNYYSNPANNCKPAFSADDSDSDEACDEEEDHDDDEVTAYNNYYPSASGYGRYMFEDLWPAAGDYDFNDLVMSYHYNVITNSQNKVTEIQLTYIVEAIGASNQNGFGIQLNGIAPNKIVSVTGTRTSGASWLSVAANGTENGQTYANIIVYDNVNRFMANPGSIGINTTVGSSYVTPDTARIIIRFNTSSNSNAVAFSSIVFNPYLIVNQTRSKEVHLVNYVPTSKAATNLFGTSEDNSSVAQQRYYKSKTDLPWALDIPEQVPYPREKADFNLCYPYMAPWARSSGAQYKSWYKGQAGNRVVNRLYSH